MKNYEEELCECPTCLLGQQYLEELSYAETPEEFEDIIFDLIEEAKAIGYRNQLEEDIAVKRALLGEVEEEFEEDYEDEDDCDCDECVLQQEENDTVIEIHVPDNVDARELGQFIRSYLDNKHRF